MFILQVILIALLIIALIVLIWMGPQILFSIRHERMINKMLNQIPEENRYDVAFVDIVIELCDDEAFLWKVHSRGKHSFQDV